MSWWVQVRHVLRKDLRLTRTLLLAYIGAIVLFGTAMLGANTSEPASWLFVPFLIALLGVFALVAAVQADPVRGRNATCRTLPLHGSAVLTAKLALVVGLTAIAVIGFRLPWLAIHGLTATGAIGSLASSFVGGAWFFVTMGVIALVTPNVRGFVIVVILLFIASQVSILFLESREGEDDRASVDPAVGEGRVEGVRVSAFEPSPFGPELDVNVNLRIDDPPFELGYALSGPVMELRHPDGRVWTLSGDTQVRPFATPPALGGDTVRWIGPAAPDVHIAAFALSVDEEAWEALSSPGLRIHLRAAVDVMRPTLLARVGLSGQPTITREGRFEVLDQQREDGEPVLRIRASEATGKNLPEWDPDAAVPGGLSYVLYHAGQREAVALGGFSSHASMFGWTPAPGGYVEISELRPAARGFRWGTPGAEDAPVTVDPGWLQGAELLVFEWTSEAIRQVDLEWEVGEAGDRVAAQP